VGRRALVWAAVLAGLAAGEATSSGVEAVNHVNVPVPQHQRVALANGLSLILVPRHDIPLLAFNLVLRGGARLDPPGRDGTAALAADLLTHGAGARDAYAFADAVAGAGGSFEADAHAEFLQLHGEFLAHDSALMLGLLADAVLRPRFAADEFEKLRDRRIEELKAAKASAPQSLLGAYGRAMLFAGHPYGRPVGGSEQSLARITRADITGYYAAQSGADLATLVIAGDFNPAQLLGEVTAAFGHWQRAAAPLPELAKPARVTGRRVLLVDAPGSAQTYFWLANVGVPRRYPQRAALSVATMAFGGSFGSMLNQELRVKAGLTYGANAHFNRGEVAGEFAITSFTQTDNTARAVDLALATLERLKQQALDLPAGAVPAGVRNGCQLGPGVRRARAVRAAGELHRRIRHAAAQGRCRHGPRHHRGGISRPGESRSGADRGRQPHSRCRRQARAADRPAARGSGFHAGREPELRPFARRAAGSALPSV
jgi:zinc protease